MTDRYKSYNEITFEAYCKTSIDHAILKGRMAKTRRAAREVPLSSLADADLYGLYMRSEKPSLPEKAAFSFVVAGISIPVHGQRLGQALAFLPPKLRDVVLLHYFLKISDPQIAALLHISKSAVQRRRTAALQRLKEGYP